MLFSKSFYDALFLVRNELNILLDLSRNRPPKINILSSFAHLYVIPTLLDFHIFLAETQ